MKRKEFLNWAGIGLLASFLPVALAACSSNESQNTTTTDTKSEPVTTNPPNTDGDGFLAVGTIEELDSKGYIIDRKSKVIVFRDEANVISAMSLLCTHQGCSVEWQKTSNNLYCGCHGSEFSADGKVTNGPANTPLSPFEVKEENESVMVKIG